MFALRLCLGLVVVVFSNVARTLAAKGQLLLPHSGTTYHYPNDLIHIKYQRVVTPSAKTLDIIVYLNALNDTYYGVPFPVLGGIQSCNNGQDPIIDATILIPVGGFCGDFALTVYEHQLTNGAQTTFLSASPTIHIDCPPPVGPPSKRDKLAERANQYHYVLPPNGATISNHPPGIGSFEVLYTAEVSYNGPLGIDLQIYSDEALWNIALGLASTPCSIPSAHVFNAFFSPPEDPAACGSFLLTVSLHGEDAGPDDYEDHDITLDC